jgi:Ser/Thr protein kinase RdoA (MazF antagonist)
VRVGDTVRRAAGPWTPTIHALLRHLRASGLSMVPEPLGIDEQGREIISLLPGPVATYPLADYVLAERPDAVWQWQAHEPAEVICHNDFAPYNLMFEDGEPTGVIDFDLASPGPRVWDMAYTAYRFVPLTAPENPDVAHPGDAEMQRRLSVFTSAYSYARVTPADVAAAAIANLRELVDFIVTSAEAGDAAQQVVLARGDTAIYERDIAYLESR